MDLPTSKQFMVLAKMGINHLKDFHCPATAGFFFDDIVALRY